MTTLDQQAFLHIETTGQAATEAIQRMADATAALTPRYQYRVHWQDTPGGSWRDILMPTAFLALRLARACSGHQAVAQELAADQRWQAL